MPLRLRASAVKIINEQLQKHFTLQRRPCPHSTGKTEMGHMELCGLMDQHEPVHTYLHARQFPH